MQNTQNERSHERRLFVEDIAARYGLMAKTVRSYASSSDPQIAGRLPPVHTIDGLRALWWVEAEVITWERERERVRNPVRSRGRPHNSETMQRGDQTP